MMVMLLSTCTEDSYSVEQAIANSLDATLHSILWYVMSHTCFFVCLATEINSSVSVIYSKIRYGTDSGCVKIVTRPNLTHQSLRNELKEYEGGCDESLRFLVAIAGSKMTAVL